MSAVNYRLTFSNSEQHCMATFMNGGPYWHLCTPGQYTEILCESEEDYKFYMNLIAICAALSGVIILTFQVMSNHFHFILEASEEKCKDFFNRLKNRMLRYYPLSGRSKNLKQFNEKILPIDNLESLRNEIVYSNRNGYLADSKYTPFSYPWGSSYAYYNFLPGIEYHKAFMDLTDREKKALCKSRVLELPEEYRVYNGIIVPESYCNIKKGEALFRNANHYFSKISKNYEAYSAVAKALGESTVLTDNEMFSVISAKSKREHDENRPSRLSQNVKLDYARFMRQDFFASEGQIHRILALDLSVVRELFGH